MERHRISAKATLREALARINALPGDAMTLFAFDDAGRLVGSLTDGDIRRGLLSGRDMESPVAEVMCRNFKSITPGCDTFALVRRAKSAGIDLLPELDATGALVRIIHLSQIKDYVPIDAVLMAGGRGERLRPLTLDTPKPLLPVGGQPIIEYNVSNLLNNGIRRFFITVNYLREQLQDYFRAHPRAEGICVEEPKRLGTFGSLGLITDWRHDNVLVMNSDLLTNVDIAAMYKLHTESDADITIGAVPYTVAVPYAILDLDQGSVKGLKEKPTYNYFANGGVYMVKRHLVERIPAGEYLDAPDFIESVIAEGGLVRYYAIEGTWIDIGSPDDYANACRLMEGRARNL